MIRLVLALLLLAAPALAAVSPEEILPDPKLEARARHLGKELRCLVCQNQSIDDSDAPLAKDLRHIVRERLVAGDSDARIKDYLVARYGDFVLLEPPMRLSTLALWLGPFAVLALGGALIALHLRRRGREPALPQALSPEERRRLEAVLAGESNEERA